MDLWKLQGGELQGGGKKLCDLPGRVGGGKVHIIALQKCWPDYLVQHSAKTGPLTVSCQQSTYLKNNKVKQGTTGTGKVHIRA